MGVGGQGGGLWVHGIGVGAKVGHGVHIPLQVLQGQVGILHLTDGVGIARQEIGGALRGKVVGESAEIAARGETDQRRRRGGGHLAEIGGVSSGDVCGGGTPEKTAGIKIGPLVSVSSRTHGRRLQRMLLVLLWMLLLLRVLLGGLRGARVEGMTTVAHHDGRKAPSEPGREGGYRQWENGEAVKWERKWEVIVMRGRAGSASDGHVTRDRWMNGGGGRWQDDVTVEKERDWGEREESNKKSKEVRSEVEFKIRERKLKSR